MTSLYLASQSPRRRELLAQIGVHIETLSVNVPEVPAAGESPEQYVCRLALEKSRAGVLRLSELGLPGRPVLGADTIGVCAGRLLEKPVDEEDAVAMLMLMSGRDHLVHTAVALSNPGQQEIRLVTTEVRFRPFDEEVARRYWATGEPADKAGAYGIQGRGAALVEHINGSYSGVVGLPLAQTCELLDLFGVPYWQG
ncbi:nucleoside triphosphate pyrophosphatase [Pseudomaricurvus sp. HS19]|uniref:Maf family protein n=1 Tax=Pseudomaricurvus sp. HS19 TaxID=2692626 RepID=UPI0013691085|nr:Maf family protein [Pseudomaricurvus sp. HS19]MYM64939.1 septum formation inhibitor Maf [Pseudomaricurvus sp. HS19]